MTASKKTFRLQIPPKETISLRVDARVHCPDPYAHTMAAAMRVRRGDRVLDLGCVPTRFLGWPEPNYCSASDKPFRMAVEMNDIQAHEKPKTMCERVSRPVRFSHEASAGRLWRDCRTLKTIVNYIIQSRSALFHDWGRASARTPLQRPEVQYLHGLNARAKARAHTIKRYSVPLASKIRDLRVLRQSLESHPHMVLLAAKYKRTSDALHWSSKSVCLCVMTENYRRKKE
jgi:hypothetical protein